jgi:hypothetical protein
MSTENELPWTAHVELDDGGQWQRIRWTLAAWGLREALLGSGQSSPTRSADLIEERNVLLLSDVITLDDNLLALNLFARRDMETTDSLVMEAVVTPEKEMLHPISATLHWSAHTQTAPLDQDGRVLFRGLRIDELIDLSQHRGLTDVQIEIERLGPTNPSS